MLIHTHTHTHTQYIHIYIYNIYADVKEEDTIASNLGMAKRGVYARSATFPT